MKFKLLLIFLIVLLSTVTAQAENLFLFDQELNVGLEYDDNSGTFIEKFKLAGRPVAVIKINDLDKYAIIQTPFEASKKNNFPGELLIVDCNTGEIDKTIPLGYAPYQWRFLPERQDILIFYQTSSSGENSELLKYNLVEMTEETLLLNTNKIYDIIISNHNQSIYALTQYQKTKKDIIKVINKISISPLKIESSLDIGKYSCEMHLLNQERIVTIERNSNRTVFNPLGNVKLIDTAENKIIDQHELKSDFAVVEKDLQNNVIHIVNYKFNTWNFAGVERVNGKHTLLSIDSKGIRVKEYDQAFIGIKYIAPLNLLFILNGSSLRIVDYQKSLENEYSTSRNYEVLGDDRYRGDQIYYLPDSHFLMIYNTVSVQGKIFDLNQNKEVMEVKSGRKGKRFIGKATGSGLVKALVKLGKELTVFKHPSFEDSLETQVAYAPSSGQTYIFDKMTLDITILDGNFEKKGLITSEEELRCMYQSREGKKEIYVSTTQQLYRLDPNTNSLAPVYKFTNEIKKDSLIIRNNHLLYLTNLELVIIDAETHRVNGAYYLYGNSGGLKYLFL